MPFPTYAQEGGATGAAIAYAEPQVARGVGAVFEVEFFDDAPTNSVPSVPSNSVMYPAFSIVDPSGIQVASGVGTPGSSAGRWQTTYIIPPLAPLSTISAKWRVVWNMVTSTGRQLSENRPFSVIELRTPNTLEDLRVGVYLTYEGQSERLVLRLPRRPAELSVVSYPATSLTNPAPNTTNGVSFTGSLALGNIIEVEEQNMFTYYFDTPDITALGEHQIIWSVRQTLTSARDTIIQQLVVPPAVFWSLVPPLRTLIDKLQKKSGTVYAYRDADIYSYFSMGVGYLNSASPVSNWDLRTFPYNSMTMRFLIEATALAALQAQQITAIELNFSFSGQSVTLDQDLVGGLGEVIQRLLDDVFSGNPGSWAKAKVGYIRAVTPIAHVANRIMGRRSFNNHTFKVNSSYIGSSSPYASTLNGESQQVGLGFTLSSVMLSLGLH
jgi:hypothetical protein